MLQQSSEAKRWAEEGLAQFRKSGNRRGEATILNTLAVIEANRAAYPEGIYYGEQALKIGQELDFIECIGHAASNIGLDYTYLGDNEKAIEYFEISLNAWKRSRDPIGHGNAWLNLGVAMNSLECNAEALRCHRQAEQIYKEAGHTRGLAMAWMNIARELRQQGNLEEALPAAEKAVSAARTFEGERQRLANILEGYAEILSSSGRDEEAYQVLSEAGDLYREIGQVRGEVNIALKTAALSLTPSGERLSQLQDAVRLAEQIGLRPEQAQAHEQLAAIAETSGKWEEAYRHACRQHQLTREVIREKAAQNAKLLEIQFGLEQARAEAEIERLRNVELAKALEEGRNHRLLAEEASRQKSELLNLAAHDLRNLTVSILTSADLACQIAGEEDVRKDMWNMLDNLKSASGTLHETLTHLLDASAVESGTTRVNRVRFDFRSTITSLVDSWKNAASDKGQSLNLDAPEQAIPVLADPVHVRQIIDNFLSNAVKYAPLDTTIRVRIQTLPDGSAQCSVSDEGPGLTSGDLEKLYRPFQRLSATPTGSEPSVGLGLFIVKKLAELQDIQVHYAPREGGGSVFSIILPGPPG